MVRGDDIATGANTGTRPYWFFEGRTRKRFHFMFDAIAVWVWGERTAEVNTVGFHTLHTSDLLGTCLPEG